MKCKTIGFPESLPVLSPVVASVYLFEWQFTGDVLASLLYKQFYWFCHSSFSFRFENVSLASLTMVKLCIESKIHCNSVLLYIEILAEESFPFYLIVMNWQIVVIVLRYNKYARTAK